MANEQEKKAAISEAIRGVPDFPVPGILFWDVTTLLLNTAAYQYTMELLTERYKEQQIDAIAALESRGFVFGAPLALASTCPSSSCVNQTNSQADPSAKRTVLEVCVTGKKISESYDLEYGSDTMEMHSDAVQPGQRVVIVRIPPDGRSAIDVLCRSMT